jgi:hypothetical protein
MAQSGKLYTCWRNLECIKKPKLNQPQCFKNLCEICQNLPKGQVKPLTFSESDTRHGPKWGRFGEGTIHVGSGGHKFSEWYWTFRSRTPKIRWSRYQSSIKPGSFQVRFRVHVNQLNQTRFDLRSYRKPAQRVMAIAYSIESHGRPRWIQKRDISISNPSPYFEYLGE